MLLLFIMLNTCINVCSVWLQRRQKMQLLVACFQAGFVVTNCQKSSHPRTVGCGSSSAAAATGLGKVLQQSMKVRLLQHSKLLDYRRKIINWIPLYIKNDRNNLIQKWCIITKKRQQVLTYQTGHFETFPVFKFYLNSFSRHTSDNIHKWFLPVVQLTKCVCSCAQCVERFP